MERIALQAPLGPVVLRDETLRRRAGGDQIRDHDRDETADHDLQRDRQDRLPHIAQSVQLRPGDERRGENGPDDDAAEQRRTAAPRAPSDNERFDRQDHQRNCEQPAPRARRNHS